MMSKESEYLIHLAEKQLDRLNNSLYYYQRNAEIQEDLLECSIDDFIDQPVDLNLAPIYAIIDRQRHESDACVASRSSADASPPRKQIKKIGHVPASQPDCNDNHIRAWRTGMKLAHQTLGPNKQTSPKRQFIQTPASNVTRKEKLSTFWDYNGYKRTGKIAKSVEDIERPEKEMSKCCSRKDSYSRNEIRKYIRDKQRLYKEKQFEPHSNPKVRKERLNTAPTKLSNNRYGDCHMIELDDFDNKTDKIRAGRWRTNGRSKTVYDELSRQGVFDHRGPKKTVSHPTSQSPLRMKNGLNTTNDSGIETGEWIQGSVGADTPQTSNDQPRLQIPGPPLKLPGESTRKQDLRHVLPLNKKSKGGYSLKVNKDYKDHMSAYDASSENDLGNDNGLAELTPPQSPMSSHENQVICLSQLLQSSRSVLNISDTDLKSKGNIRKIKKSDGKFSISMPNCNADFSWESSINKSQGDLRTPVPHQFSLAEELKQALLEAQMQLSRNNGDLRESLSEQISVAVQNFLKTKEQTSGSIDAVDGDGQQSHITDNHKLTYKKSDKNKCKNERKREHLSTECEATEIEHEHGEQVSKIEENDSPSHVQPEFEEQISEERSFLSMDSDKSEVIDEVMKDNIVATIETRKKNLKSRRDNACELIKLTHDLKKESKKVKLLEQKACQISKQYFLDSKIDKANTESPEYQKNPLKLIGLATLPRHTIPPDGKDNARFDTKEQTGLRQPSPRMTEIESEGEICKDHSVPPDMTRWISNISSDVEEPTVSISDVSTTLTDQSELEARLVALRSERTKKLQLVAVLKSRQKEMKRDKMKQKEIILQKQIDMYDSYISKVQSSIDEIDNKVNDVESDESRTLTASITNINDIESKVEDLDDEAQQVFVADDLDIEDMYKQCCDDSLQEDDGFLDEIVENNIRIAGDDVNFNVVHEIYKEDDFTKPLEIFEGGNVPADVLISDLDDLDQDHTIVDDVATVINYESDDHFNEVVRKNDFQKDEISVHNLDEMYIKECNIVDRNCDDTVHILDDLMVTSVNCASSGDYLSHPTVQSTPKCEEVNSKFGEEVEKKKKEDTDNHPEESENAVKQNLPPPLYPNLLEFSTDKSWESVPVVRNSLDDPILNLPVTLENDDFIETDDCNLRYASNFSDDDGSSISDAKSVRVIEEDLLEDFHSCDQVNLVMHSTEDVQDVPFDVVGMPSLIDQSTTPPAHSESSVQKNDDPPAHEELLNAARIEELVECILNAIVFSEIEQVKLQTAQVELEEDTLVSAAENVDLQSTSFIDTTVTVFPPVNKETLQSHAVAKSEDIWEFTDVSLEEPLEVLESSLAMTGEIADKEESVEKNDDAISIIDKQLLSEKIKWLIPMKEDHLDAHINSAILHFFQAKQKSQSPIEDSLSAASENLPEIYTDSMSVVSDIEVGDALLGTSKQNSYIDKRIIFQLVKEIFSEIYSFERYLPQMPWVHSSFMIKRKNYTTWKGDKPPESYDLVSKIVRERICQLFNQKNVLLGNVGSVSTESPSHSKITKWCIERQKDQVDKLLINDLRKEENEWVYYDDAEEEIKIQIAEEVFNFLMADTVSWLKSILSQNKKC